MKRLITMILIGAITGAFNLLQAQVSYSNCSNSGTNANALGYYSLATGNYSFAAGYYTKATANNSFTFGAGLGSSATSLVNNTPNSFLVGFSNTPVLFAKLEPEPTQFIIGTDPIYGPMVGIGTKTPAANLDVIGKTKVETLRITGWVEYPEGGLSFWPYSSSFLGTYLTPTLTLSGGKVGIGISANTSSSYTLAVNGSIGCKEIFVETESWPDYVFSDDYTLRSLSDVASFISENGHLPEVPSAREVEEANVGLGAMNTILLKKIEELTLYILQQQEQIEVLSERMKHLEKEE